MSENRDFPRIPPKPTPRPGNLPARPAFITPRTAPVIPLRSASLIRETRQLIVGYESTVLSALGIPPPKNSSWHVHCPLPTHEDKRASFRVDKSTGHYFCSCGHGDLLDLIQGLGHAHDVVSACSWARELLGHPRIGSSREETVAERAEREVRIAGLLAQAAETQRRREAERAAYGERQLSKAVTMLRRSLHAGGTIAESYLASRGIKCGLYETIRFLTPASPQHHPCMIVPFGLSSEMLGGAHLTFLKSDGSGKAKNENGDGKITIGIDHNFPLVISPARANKALLITEGIEDALSGHQVTGMSAWAAGTAPLMPGLAERVPENVKVVVILQDADDSGERNSELLAGALHSRGIPVMISRGF